MTIDIMQVEDEDPKEEEDGNDKPRLEGMLINWN